MSAAWPWCSAGCAISAIDSATDATTDALRAASAAATPAPVGLTPLVPLHHLALAVLVVAIWGTNFVVIKVALAQLPPLLFAALRFTLAALPAMLLLKRPALPWRNLAGYGLFIGVGQFSLLYLAMRSQISPGLASLVIQSQVFFTMGMALLLAGERVRLHQWLACTLALVGFGVIAAHVDGTTTVLGVAMVLIAAFSWALGNTVGRRAGQVNMLAYVVWSSAFAAPPLWLLSMLVEGPPSVLWRAMAQADTNAWLAVLWQSLGNSVFGYGMWAWLLSRYAAASIVPMALLVPVFGMSASVLLLGEPFPAWKGLAMLLVMGGLSINVLWPRLRRAVAPR